MEKVITDVETISRGRRIRIIADNVQDNLDSVGALIKKHEDFEKTLDTQEEKIHALDQFAQKLMTDGHYDSVAIASRKNTVLARYEALAAIAWLLLDTIDLTPKHYCALHVRVLIIA